MIAHVRQRLWSLIRGFTMIELVIALVVIVVAVLSIMVLFPVGLDANRGTVSRSNAIDSAKEFLRISQSNIRSNWNYVSAFPTTRPYADGDPAETLWSANSIIPGNYLRILWFVNQGSQTAPFDPAVHNTGMFKVVHVGVTGEVEFSAVVRAWVDVQDYGDGSAETAKRATLNAEISWPAHLPYARRQVEVIPVEIFNPGEVSNLIVNLATERVLESAGASATVGTVTRAYGDLSQPLTVTLSSSDTSEATVAVSSVVIPAGASSTTFAVNAVDDNVQDGDQTVVFTATDPAGIYKPGQDRLQVIDDEELILIVTIDRESIPENGALTATATVTRLGPNSNRALSARIVSSDQQEAVPSTYHLTFRPNETTATFTILAVDDKLLDGDQTVTFKATSNNYQSIGDTIVVTDVESLTVVINPDQIKESDGAGAATVTVTRSNTDTNQPLTVTISLDQGGVIGAPTTVTIPAGQTSATFTVDAIDNEQVMAQPAVVTLTATAAGYQPGADTIRVDDDEPLMLTVSKAQVSENDGATAAVGTVTRPAGNNDAPLVVTLTSSDSSELTVPATVTIPAGQNSVTFPIAAIDDNLLDGSQEVTLAAATADLRPAVATVTVSDYEFLIVEIGPETVWETATVPITGTVRRSNIDPADPAFQQPLTVTLTSSDITELQAPVTVTIPAGQGFANFTLSPVPDDLLDGNQLVNITASATGYNNGQDTLTVLDANLALALAAGANGAAIWESAAAGTNQLVLTVRRAQAGTAITIQLASNDLTEAIVIPDQLTLAADQLAADVVVTAVDDTLLDGNQLARITATASGYTSAGLEVTVLDDDIAIAIAADTIRENQGDGATTVTITRGSGAGTLVVTLASSDTSEATLAATTVTFAAGQTAIVVAINAVNDNELDGDQTVTVTATAATGKQVSDSLVVTDTTLLVTLAQNPVFEGGSTIGTVTRGDTDGPLTVTLSSSDESEATVTPVTVTIPDGQLAATFRIEAPNDGLDDGDQQATIVAAAPDYDNGSATLTVLDNEALRLSLTVQPSSFLETAGTYAAFGTVTRNGNLDQPLTVTLNSSDTGEATVPVTVTIPAGQASVSFVVSAVADNLPDGDQQVTLTASAAEYTSGAYVVTVRDADAPALALTIYPTMVVESAGPNAAIGTVSRNTDPTEALTVTLSSSNSNYITVPLTVVIPAGETSVTFPIAAIDDSRVNGERLVTITASAADHQSAAATLRVLDDDAGLALALSVSPSRFPAGSGAGVAVGTVSRNGNPVADLVVSLISSDASAARAPATVTIPAGSAGTTFAVDAPSADGGLAAMSTKSSDQLVSSVLNSDGTGSTIDEVIVDFTARAPNHTDGFTTVTVWSGGDVEPPSIGEICLEDDNGPDRGENTVTINVDKQTYCWQNVNFTQQGDLEVTLTYRGQNRDEIVTIHWQTVDHEPQMHGMVNLISRKGNAHLNYHADAQGPQAQFNIHDQNIDDSTCECGTVDEPTLAVVLTPDTISESAGANAAIGTVYRNGANHVAPLVVQLTSSDQSEASVAASVTIPAGSAFTTFSVAAVDDDAADGNQTVAIIAAAAGYIDGQANLVVLDEESRGLNLTFSPDSVREDEGEMAAVGTVIRTGDLSAAATINLASSDLTEATVPASVTIAAGQSAATFYLDAVDDGEYDGDQEATVTASAAGYQTASTTVAVRDTTRAFTVVAVPNTFARSAGAQASIGTVTRYFHDLDAPLTVSLATSDVSAATVPTTVTIPGGASATTFYIAAVPFNGNGGGDGGAGNGDDGGVAVGGGANINPNNSPHMEFTLHKAGGGSITRDDLHKDSPVGGDGTYFEGGATYILLKPKGNGNQNSLLIDGKVYPLRNSSVYTFTGNLTARVWNAKVKNGKAMGHWWIDLSGSGVVVTEDDTPIGVAEPDPVTGCETVQLTLTAAAPPFGPSVEILTVTCSEEQMDALTLAVNPSSFAKTAGADAAVGTVTRDSATTAALAVTLTSSDPGAATVPATVTIPAGQASTTFFVGAVDNHIAGASRPATITATAAQHADAQAVVTVTDGFFGNGLVILEKIVLTGSSQIVGSAVTNATAAGKVDLAWSTRITGNLTIGPGGVATTVIKSPQPNPLNHIGGQVGNLTEPLAFALPPFPTFPAGQERGDISLQGGTNNNRTLLPAEYDGGRFGDIRLRNNRVLTIDLQGQARTIRVGTLRIEQGHIVLKNAGSLTIYVESGIVLGGDSTINNGGSAQAAHIYYEGAAPIVPGGNTRYFGTIYAKQADLTIPGSSGIMGHIVCGGANVSITGDASALVRALFAPAAKVLVTGSGNLRGGLVCRELEGTGNIRVTHDAGYADPIPDLPGQ